MVSGANGSSEEEAVNSQSDLFSKVDDSEFLLSQEMEESSQPIIDLTLFDEIVIPSGENLKLKEQTARPEFPEPESPKSAKEVAISTLHSIGLTSDQVDSFAPQLGVKGFSALVNFHLGCQYAELPIKWGDKQIKAYLVYVHVKFYTAAYLQRQWSILKKVASILDSPISDENKRDFNTVLSFSKDIKDNKVPVSVELLIQLCTAADKLFTGYTVKLAKAIFITAWAAYLRISEYSRTKEGNQHNLHRNAIITSADGLSIKFLTDKTTKESDPIKHRLIRWWVLPWGSEDLMKDYERSCPAGAHNFFCTEDGLELDRNAVLNLLEPCLLLSDWRFLSVTPHAFRLGAASHARAIGINISEIYYIGRWTDRSKAIEAYTRPDIVVLSPQAIYNQLPHYRRDWSPARILFIARHVVESPGNENHPYKLMVNQFFPELSAHPDMPAWFPHTLAIEKMQNMEESITSGTHLKKFALERDEQNQQFQARNEQAKLVRKEARDRLRGKMILEPLPQSFTKHAGIKAGFSTCARTQTDHTPIELSDAMVQTSPVVVLTTDQFKALKDSGAVPDSPVVPAVPPVDSDVLDPLSEPVFEVQSLGRKMKLTNREIRVRKMSDPELKRAKVSINCKQRKALRARIRRRISKSFRDRRNYSTAAYLEKKSGRKNLLDPKQVVKDPRQTKTIKKLIDFFVSEYQQKSTAGLPVAMEEPDPPVTDDEYEAKVLAAYCSKPDNYEELLRSQNHNPYKYVRGKKRERVARAQWSDSSEDEESPVLQDESSSENIPSDPESDLEEAVCTRSKK